MELSTSSEVKKIHSIEPLSPESDSDFASQIIDENLGIFLSSFKVNNKARQVDFRKLISWVPYSDSYTHYIHQYPAKLLKHIPIFFLNSKILLPNKNALILDPFCGSGTVLLEAVLAGHRAIGCDANPLARLIAQVKTTPLPPGLLVSELNKLIRQAKRYRIFTPKNVVNIDHWFPAHVQYDLSRLARAIDEIVDVKHKDFFKVVFSSIIKKSSYADPNLSVPVKVKPIKYKDEIRKNRAEKFLEEIDSLDVFQLFNKSALNNIVRMEKLYQKSNYIGARIVGTDARFIGADQKSRQSDQSVDLIITSPPYAGAQKYIRSSSLSLGWLDYCEENTLRHYEKQNIGREHYHVGEYQELARVGIKEIDRILVKIWEKNRLRAHINANYLLEMKDALEEMFRVLKSGGHCVLVIGNNEVCGLKFETQRYMRLIAEAIGFTTILILVDDIQSRGLMTKRNKTASIINSEWVLVLKK